VGRAARRSNEGVFTECLPADTRKTNRRFDL
jgi:hypothetical protein